MDLNHWLVNFDLENSVSLYNAVGSIHPPSVHENIGDQNRRAPKAPNVMVDWLAQLVTKGSNPQKALEQFQKLNQPAIEGEADPLQAEKWLHKIEKILNIMDYTRGERESFAFFMLQGEADHQWEMITDETKFIGKGINWGFLFKKFNEKYIPGPWNFKN